MSDTIELSDNLTDLEKDMLRSLAKFGFNWDYDNENQIIIYTNLTTDADVRLTEWEC